MGCRIKISTILGNIGSMRFQMCGGIKGQRLMSVILLTKSLGDKLADTPETYAWRDEGGARVTVVLHDGLVTDWTLERPAEPAPEPGTATPSA